MHLFRLLHAGYLCGFYWFMVSVRLYYNNMPCQLFYCSLQIFYQLQSNYICTYMYHALTAQRQISIIWSTQWITLWIIELHFPVKSCDSSLRSKLIVLLFQFSTSCCEISTCVIYLSYYLKDRDWLDYPSRYCWTVTRVTPHASWWACSLSYSCLWLAAFAAAAGCVISVAVKRTTTIRRMESVRGSAAALCCSSSRSSLCEYSCHWESRD